MRMGDLLRVNGPGGKLATASLAWFNQFSILYWPMLG
jgi:hypothetical protein